MKITKTTDVKTPTYSLDSNGLDFYVPNNSSYIIYPHTDVLIPSGIKIEIPIGYALIAFNKSGVSTKKKLLVGACVVDQSYQGEIHLHLINTSDTKVILNAGEKAVQFLLIPTIQPEIEVCEETEMFLKKSARCEKGFGSTNE